MRYQRNHIRSRIFQGSRNRNSRNNLINIQKFNISLVPVSTSSKLAHLIYAAVLITMCSIAYFDINSKVQGLLDKHVQSQIEIPITESLTLVKEGLFDNLTYVVDSDKKVCYKAESEQTLIFQLKEFVFKAVLK
jgi:hypothetical protein